MKIVDTAFAGLPITHMHNLIDSMEKQRNYKIVYNDNATHSWLFEINSSGNVIDELGLLDNKVIGDFLIEIKYRGFFYRTQHWTAVLKNYFIF